MSLYPIYPGYTCYDDHGYKLLVLIYVIISYIPWIHIVMLTLGIHCWYLSISFYLVYPGYTLLWWPWVYIAGTYLYHSTLYTLNTIVMMTLGIHCWYLSILSTLCTLDTHCNDDPGYTLLWWPLLYIAGTFLYHYTSCTQDTHCYDDPGYTFLWWPWIYIVMITLNTHCYDDPGYTL